MPLLKEALDRTAADALVHKLTPLSIPDVPPLLSKMRPKQAYRDFWALVREE